MNNRDDKHIDAILGDSRVIGGHELKPLSPARVAILDRRGNKFVKGGGGQSDLDAAAEVFFVVTREPAQLVAMRRMPVEEWLDEIEAFALDLGPDDLTEFMVYLEAELERIGATSAEPEKQLVEMPVERERTGSSAVSDSDSLTDSADGRCYGK